VIIQVRLLLKARPDHDCVCVCVCVLGFYSVVNGVLMKIHYDHGKYSL